tara:strand:+ start:2375 stop:2557 length:183 start_codon:yes stop_codon:yes gene_type:complete
VDVIAVKLAGFDLLDAIDAEVLDLRVKAGAVSNVLVERHLFAAVAHCPVQVTQLQLTFVI